MPRSGSARLSRFGLFWFPMARIYLVAKYQAKFQCWASQLNRFTKNNQIDSSKLSYLLDLLKYIDGITTTAAFRK